MKTDHIWVLALGIALISHLGLDAQAARKYYPPGFTPPVDENPLPNEAGNDTEPSTPAPVPGKQIIIKTVPVLVKGASTPPAKPRDPLLVLLDEHRYFDAMRLVDGKLKKTPTNITLQLMRGRILREEGSYNPALVQYQAILDKSRVKSVRADALNGLGWTQLAKAQRERQMGDAQASLASMTSAEQAFQQSRQLAPHLVYPVTGLGYVLLETGRIAEAEKLIKRAKQLAPNNDQVQLAEAELLLAKNKPEDALQILYGVKKTAVHNPDVYLLLARASLAKSQPDDAIINLKQLLQMVPEHTEALRLLSDSYERKMQPEDAEVVLQKAIALNPADEKSVESLLKIYDQRQEHERSILLLKTLLKDQSTRLAYGTALLERLNTAKQWDEAYTEGHSLVSGMLAGNSDTDPRLQAFAGLFTEAVYQKSRGLLAPQTLMQEPSVQAVKKYWLNRLEGAKAEPKNSLANSMVPRLNLLMLDPLTQLPPLPAKLEPPAPQLCAAVQMAYLAGDRPLQDRLIGLAAQAPDALSIAKQLYAIGDYNGSALLLDKLAANPNTTAEAVTLGQQVADTQKSLQEQLSTLSMLPKRIGDSYWQKAAGEALKLGSGNWKTHATVADALEKRRQPDLALVHQQLAAQYAPTEKDKQYWLRKADRTSRLLAANKTNPSH